MTKKILALLMALVLMMGCLAGCGGSDKQEESSSPSDLGSADASPTPGTADVETPDKYRLAADAYPADTVVMTVNGLDVRWDEYYYWLVNLAMQIESSYGEVDWSSLIDGVSSFQDTARRYAEDVISQYWAILDKAAELNLSLSEEDQAYIDSVYASDMANYANGDAAAFEEYLSKLYISPSLYRKMLEASQLYASLFTLHFGEGGEALTDEDALSYAENAGYLHAKHILVITQDANGTAMSDEDKVSRRALAQELYDELAAIDDKEQLLKRFDELMFEYSDDTGLMANPDGYHFLPGEMVAAFEEGTRALEMYAMSEVTESPYGYHIILRLPLELDKAIDRTYGYTLRYIAASALYQTLAKDWFDSAEIVYFDGFDQLDLNELFAKAE